MRFPGRSHDPTLVGLLDAAGATTERSARLLCEIVGDYPDRADLASDLEDVERSADRITGDVLRRLARRGARAPFDVADGRALAAALSDIVGQARRTADTLATYRVEAPMEQASAICHVFVLSANQVGSAVRRLGRDGAVEAESQELLRLADASDRMSRDAIASLFGGGVDPMVVIRWKDIFSSLDACVGACTRVARILEGITVKRRS